MTTSALPLDGYCVVEIGHSLAAPYAGNIFAQLGARVIKIENSKNGDYARDWGPPFIDGSSALFHAMNNGKSSIRADFDDPQSLQNVRRLIIEQADIVLQNLKPGSLERHGLSAQDMTQSCPKLIYCNLGAFGANGPMQDKPGYDPLIQAFSGMMSITGGEGDAPSRVPVSLNDMGTGMWAAIGVLALLAQSKSGTPISSRIVDVSLYETALSWMTVPLSDRIAGGLPPKRSGSGSPNIVPYQVFQCSDKEILVAAGNDTLYLRLCQALGLDALASDPRFISNGQRVLNREALIELLQRRFKQCSSDHWLQLLARLSIPCGPLQTLDQVIANEQTRALDILLQTPDEKVRTVALPISFDGQRPRLAGNTPQLGEHDQLLND